MILTMNYEVAMRYLFTKPTIWVSEVSHYILAAIFTWGLAYGLNEGAHIAVDVIKNRLPGRVAVWLDAVTSSLSAIMVVFLIWMFGDMIMGTIARQEVSSSFLRVPLQWPRIGAGLGLLLFVGPAMVLCWRNWRKASAGKVP